MLLLFIWYLIELFFLVFPLWVTFETIRSFTTAKKWPNRINDFIVIVIAPFLTILYGNVYLRISNNPWTEVNVNTALHAPIWPDTIPTFIVLIGLSLIGYIILRPGHYDKLPPLVLALAIAFLYIGMALSLLWSIQMLTLTKELISYVFMCLMPWNYALICIRELMKVIDFCDKQGWVFTTTWQLKLYHLIYKGRRLPWAAFFLLVPLLGIISLVLTLFGQEPDAMIKMWTNTSDWTLSQKVSPPSVTYDEHYLCTVGASGHRKLVKPIRMGVRHGHRIVVNRQLLIANAFEQIIEEKLPRTHRWIRRFYDNYGYPISRHIKKTWQADLIYLLMKPLEWFFLIVLYATDTKPENRIATQYLSKEGLPKTETPLDS